MQLYIIRHAQSENNANWNRLKSNLKRKPDPPLSPLGRRQGETLAQFLASTQLNIKLDYPDNHNRRGFFLTHLYSSLMQRSIQTGQFISRVTGLPLVAWKDLHEWGGIYTIDIESDERTGQQSYNRDFYVENYPELIIPDWLDEKGWWSRPYEQRQESNERAKHVWLELLNKHEGKDDRVAIITHGGFSVSLFHAFMGISEPKLGLDPPKFPFLHLSNTSISRIDIDEERFLLRYYNRVDFLPADQIS